jgi:hypothetical protein
MSFVQTEKPDNFFARRSELPEGALPPPTSWDDLDDDVPFWQRRIFLRHVLRAPAAENLGTVG